jgi:hypothetical protein
MRRGCALVCVESDGEECQRIVASEDEVGGADVACGGMTCAQHALIAPSAMGGNEAWAGASSGSSASTQVGAGVDPVFLHETQQGRTGRPCTLGNSVFCWW